MVDRNHSFTQHTYQCGLVYLALLFAVAILSLSGVVTSELWSTLQRRDREHELLLVGDQFRQAIGEYYETSLGGAKHYPQRLEDLLKDNRSLVTKRYLRKIYRDPITLKTDWGIIAAPSGGIMGVHSLSNMRPIESAGFEPKNYMFKGAENYSEWKFIYEPPSSLELNNENGKNESHYPH